MEGEFEPLRMPSRDRNQKYFYWKHILAEKQDYSERVNENLSRQHEWEHNYVSFAAGSSNQEHRRILMFSRLLDQYF